ncbi:hypothetical protein PYW08_000353 [Mythimna loreyi]|uniref:Uncharacterized protein n=1 Tax=Mythimna loreyi TaxID=667449 RepID=A0ACC2RC86_9NEOP|nr:hypothetical protein PYW08_000353 [Mythimna loreyi]
MFVGYVFFGFFTLFAFFFLEVVSQESDNGNKKNGTNGTEPNETEETGVRFTTRAISTTTIKTEDLKSLDMGYYCKFQAATRVCNKKKVSNKFFFDIKLRECVNFEYGHCNHSYNMFDTKHTCMEACRDEVNTRIPDDALFNVFCRFQPDFGDCNQYIPMFYYDITDGKCKGFAYSGCGGNHNRFPNAIKCIDVCGLLFMNNF